MAAASGHGTTDQVATEQDGPTASATSTAEASEVAPGGNGAEGSAADGSGDGKGVDGRSHRSSDDREHQRGTKLTYNPALDGIRGLALMSVLLYHGYEGTLFKGSFLAVSTFFTLSGFLITSLLLGEHRKRGGIALGGFYSRRLRRLLPASALTLLVVMLTALITDELWERELSQDVIAAGLHVANWRFLFEDRAYADLFQDNQSLVLHFWSLAIEEQFYWIFPLLTAGLLWLFRGSLKAYTRGLLVLLAVALGLTWMYGNEPNTVYYATPIRGGEILMGGLLAALVARGWFLGNKRLAPWLAGIGVVMLVFQVWAWWVATQQHESLRWGGLLAYSATSALLVLSSNVAGPVRSAMSFEPLRQLGVVSYGVYLFHWPLFKLLSEERVDSLFSPIGLQLRSWSLLLFRLLVVLALSAASYHWFELPLRRGGRPKLVNPQALALTSVVGVLLVAVAVPRISEPPVDELAAVTENNPLAAQPYADDGVFQDESEFPQPPNPADVPGDAQVGVVVGDSTMLMTALGLRVWGEETGNGLVISGGSANPGCAIGTGGEVLYQGSPQPMVEECANWKEMMIEKADEAEDIYGHVEFALIQAGPWDVADRRLEGDTEWRHMGDPVYDSYLRQEMEDATSRLIDRGLTVIWLTSPVIDPDREGNDGDEFDPARMERLNQLIDEVAAERPQAHVVDLAAWMAEQPPERDAELRPDSIHFTVDSATEVSGWLGPEIEAVLDSPTTP